MSFSYNISSDEAYVILGVSPFATFSEIKRAYYDLALKFHPDKQAKKEDQQDDSQQRNKDSGKTSPLKSNKPSKDISATAREKAEEQFKKISGAYEKLKEENSNHNNNGNISANRQRQGASTSQSSFYNTSGFNFYNHHTPRRNNNNNGSTSATQPNSHQQQQNFFARASPRFEHPYMSGVPASASSATSKNPYFTNLNPEDVESLNNPSATSARNREQQQQQQFPFSTPSKPRSCASYEEPLPPSPDKKSSSSSKKFRQKTDEEILSTLKTQQQPEEKPEESSPTTNGQDEKVEFHNNASAPSGYTLSPNAVDSLNRLKRRHEAAQQFAKKDQEHDALKGEQSTNQKAKDEEEQPIPAARSNRNASSWVEELFKKQKETNHPTPTSLSFSSKNSNHNNNNIHTSTAVPPPPPSRGGFTHLQQQQRPESARLPNSRPISSAGETASSSSAYAGYNLNMNFDFLNRNNNSSSSPKNAGNNKTKNEDSVERNGKSPSPSLASTSSPQQQQHQSFSSVSRKNPFGWVDDMCKNAHESNVSVKTAKKDETPNVKSPQTDEKEKQREFIDDDDDDDDNDGEEKVQEDPSQVDETWVEKAFGEIRRKYHEKETENILHRQQQQQHQKSATSRRPFSAGVRWGTGNNNNKSNNPNLQNKANASNSTSPHSNNDEVVKRLHEDDETLTSPLLRQQKSPTKNSQQNSQESEQRRRADEDEDFLPSPMKQQNKKVSNDDSGIPDPPPRRNSSSKNFLVTKGTFLVPADEVILGGPDEFSERELLNLIEHLGHKMETAAKALEERNKQKKK